MQQFYVNLRVPKENGTRKSLSIGYKATVQKGSTGPMVEVVMWLRYVINVEDGIAMIPTKIAEGVDRQTDAILRHVYRAHKEDAQEWVDRFHKDGRLTSDENVELKPGDIATFLAKLPKPKKDKVTKKKATKKAKGKGKKADQEELPLKS
jgi:hypothetical protein